jgi:hypothetical protein
MTATIECFQNLCHPLNVPSFRKFCSAHAQQNYPESDLILRWKRKEIGFRLAHSACGAVLGRNDK